MSAETSMTDEVKIIAEKILSWAQILITELCSIKSCTKENIQNMKTCTNLLYTFVMNWDNLTLTTSVDTAISTSAVATLSSSQESVNCINSLTLKQLTAAMRVNWHSKWLSQVCNETDAQLIIFKYKKNTMKKKRKASYRSEKIMCFSLKVLVSN